MKYPGATLPRRGWGCLRVTATTAAMVRRHKTWVTTNTNFRLYNGHSHTLSFSCLLARTKKRRAGVSQNPTNKTGCPCCRYHKSFVIYLRHLASSKAICHLIINFCVYFFLLMSFFIRCLPSKILFWEQLVWSLQWWLLLSNIEETWCWSDEWSWREASEAKESCYLQYILSRPLLSGILALKFVSSHVHLCYPECDTILAYKFFLKIYI